MVASNVYFYNSDNGDRVYDADSFSDWLRKFFTTGVFANELYVTSTGGMNVQVSAGYANVDGKVKNFTGTTAITLAAASSTLPRIDTIVVRRNDTDRDITIEYVQGQYSGQNPYPTEPTRTSVIYELVLAQISVGAGATSITQADITDTRMNSDLCGYVAGTVKEINFNQISAQFRAYLNQFEAENLDEFDEWFDEMKDQLSTDAAGHLQLEIDETNGQVEAISDRVDALVPVFGQYTLLANRWNNAEQSAFDGRISTTSVQLILPAVGITAAQYTAFVNAKIVYVTQGETEVVLKALGTVPTIDIPIRILFLYRG